MAAVGPSTRQNHSYSSNVANNKQAQLATAYQQLSRELASDKIKVVGGYTLGKVIGEGTFGSVHLATHRLTGTRCAIKKIPKSATPQLTREIHHHRRLHHPNIVHLHEIIATESHIWLVSEICSGGELFDYLVERGRLLEGEGRRIFGELCTAVGFLHKEGVVHRDLKLENVLLDGELKVKLGDLGFAREFQRGRLMDTFCGTTGYASPEMLSCKNYSGVETDIWSLGIILYTLLCGGLPFDDDDERVMKDLILKGEYEEPEWLSDDAKSLIRGMLQHNPEDRLTMEGILTHPWFQKVIYDSIPGATSTDKPHSIPPSPMPGQAPFGESLYKSPSSSNSVTSFPFSPRTSIPTATKAIDAAASPEADSGPSDTSFEFVDSNASKDVSDNTTPTTAEDEDAETAQLQLIQSAERSKSDPALDLKLNHANNSQSTIRKPESPSTASMREKIARRNTLGRLEGHFVDDPTKLASLPMIDENSLPLPVADHSRTPVRTKRRSVTSQISMERRHSHQSTSSQWQVFPADDYLALLKAERPPFFSTPSEKQLLHHMADLGFDSGQIVHSVNGNACDCSAAMWWILRFKQMERGETDDLIQSRELAAQHRRERRAARVKERRDPSRDHSPTPRPVEDAPTLTVSSAGPSSPKAAERALSSIGSSNTLHATAETSRQSPPPSPRTSQPQATLTPTDLSPNKDRKSRTGSMNMLQRATSVLALGMKKDHKDKDHDHGGHLKPDSGDTSGSWAQDHTSGLEDKTNGKRAESPIKLGKIGGTTPGMRLTKSESDPMLLTLAGLNGSVGSKRTSEEPSPSRVSSVVADTLHAEDSGQTKSAESTLRATKAQKKDSIWMTFRHLFNEDKRRAKKIVASPVRDQSKPPTVVPTRGSNARGAHKSRPSLASSRRASMEGRPLYSHRSSAVNSRRSSVASSHIPDFAAINLQDGLHYGNLNRRTSGRSVSGRSLRSLADADGVQTPSSERGGISRSGSIHSVRRGGGAKRSSMRSPNLSDSASGRVRGGPPASPLHDYHRRAASGSSSSRVRHIKVIHEAKALRPNSVASSVRSNASSRASSFDFARGDFDSDYDTGREDGSSSLSLRRGLPSSSELRGSIHRGRSPLSRTGRRKAPLRDVFLKKDDESEWESEEDEAFAGGLGQMSSRSSTFTASGTAAYQTRWNTSTQYPGGGAGLGDLRTSTPTNSRFGASSSKRRSQGLASLEEGSERSESTESSSGPSQGSSSSVGNSGGTGRSRRGALPPSRTQAPVIEEEEEVEE